MLPLNLAACSLCMVRFSQCIYVLPILWMVHELMLRQGFLDGSQGCLFDVRIFSLCTIQLLFIYSLYRKHA